MNPSGTSDALAAPVRSLLAARSALPTFLSAGLFSASVDRLNVNKIVNKSVFVIVKNKNAKSVTVNYIDQVKTKIFAQAMLPNLLWGFGFTATIWALRGFSLLQIIFLRFAIVGLCGLLWCLLFDRKLLQKLLPMTFMPSLF